MIVAGTLVYLSTDISPTTNHKEAGAKKGATIPGALQECALDAIEF